MRFPCMDRTKPGPPVDSQTTNLYPLLVQVVHVVHGCPLVSALGANQSVCFPDFHALLTVSQLIAIIDHTQMLLHKMRNTIGKSKSRLRNTIGKSELLLENYSRKWHVPIGNHGEEAPT